MAVVHRAPLVFACDGIARAALTASWYRQMGHQHVYALDGGTSAWTAAERELETGMSRPEPTILAETRDTVPQIPARNIKGYTPAVVLHVGTSQEFAQGHPPGAIWTPRAWLERDLAALALGQDTMVIAICEDGAQSLLAARTLRELGRERYCAVAGGMEAYRALELSVETGLTGVMSPPNDVLSFGPQRGYADMQHYLRWETALGDKYAADPS